MIRTILGKVQVLKEPAVIFGIASICLWEFLCRAFNISTYLLPTPSQIAQAGYKHYGLVFVNLLYTLKEVTAGFVVASFLSIILGMLITYYSLFRRILLPYIVLVQNLPKLALAPLFIVWFGLTFITNIGIVVALAAFPVLINFVAGLEATKIEEIKLMRSYNATRWQTFYHVRLFNAMPFLFAGFKLSIVLSVAGAVVAEFIAGHKGLAYMMILSNTTLEIPLMFVFLFSIGVLGLSLFMVISLAEKVFMPWSKGRAVREATL